MRILEVKEEGAKKFLKFAVSQADVTRYLWEYHEISTSIMKSAQSWYIYVSGKWWGVGTRTLDRFPIQHWYSIYRWVKQNNAPVSAMPYHSHEEYMLEDPRDITIDHSKYRSTLI